MAPDQHRLLRPWQGDHFAQPAAMLMPGTLADHRGTVDGDIVADLAARAEQDRAGQGTLVARGRAAAEPVHQLALALDLDQPPPSASRVLWRSSSKSRRCRSSRRRSLVRVQQSALSSRRGKTAMDFVPRLLESDVPFYSHEIDAYWNDIGNLEELRQSTLDALSGAVEVEREGELVDGFRSGIRCGRRGCPGRPGPARRGLRDRRRCPHRRSLGDRRGCPHRRRQQVCAK